MKDSLDNLSDILFGKSFNKLNRTNLLELKANLRLKKEIAIDTSKLDVLNDSINIVDRRIKDLDLESVSKNMNSMNSMHNILVRNALSKRFSNRKWLEPFPTRYLWNKLVSKLSDEERYQIARKPPVNVDVVKEEIVIDDNKEEQ